MEEEAIARFHYPEELKQKLVELVVYQNYSKEEVAKKYGLVNTYMLTNWINGYKKKLEKGAVTLAPMEKPKTKDTAETEEADQGSGEGIGKSQCADLRTKLDDRPC